MLMTAAAFPLLVPALTQFSLMDRFMNLYSELDWRIYLAEKLPDNKFTSLQTKLTSPFSPQGLQKTWKLA